MFVEWWLRAPTLRGENRDPAEAVFDGIGLASRERSEPAYLEARSLKRRRGRIDSSASVMLSAWLDVVDGLLEVGDAAEPFRTSR